MEIIIIINNMKIRIGPSSKGGLFAAISSEGKIKNTKLENVDVISSTGQEFDYVGGLAGLSDGEIIKSSTSGKVHGYKWVGGLVGYNKGMIIDSSSTASVTGFTQVGGLVGVNHGTLQTTFATGNIKGFNREYYSATEIGGLVGDNGGNVFNSYATGNVMSEHTTAGGLMGSSTGLVTESYATGNVSGIGNIGGLIGLLAGKLDKTFATGNVFATIPDSSCGFCKESNKRSIGGLVGVMHDTRYPQIFNSYSTGTIDATNAREYIGGLVGEIRNLKDSVTIENSYTVGKVKGPIGEVDGFVSYIYIPSSYSGTMVGNYFNHEISPYPVIYSGITASTTEELMDKTTFVGWDFEETWGINEGEYPHLLFENKVAPIAPIIFPLNETKEIAGGEKLQLLSTRTLLTLPSDLPDGTTLLVETLEGVEAEGLSLAGEAFNFIFTFPDGLSFDDINGRFILTLGVYDEVDSNETAIYHYNDETNKWEFVGGEEKDGQITVTVEQFSQYGVFIQNLSNTIFVKEGSNGNGTSWANAFGTLQEALDVATGGDEIWIAKGMYYPTKALEANDERTKTFQMKNEVAIYGGFKGDDDNESVQNRDFKTNETILSGDLNKDGAIDDHDAYHVFYHPEDLNLNETAVLDGVTITGGNASVGSHEYAAGGGMYNSNSSPTLNNLYISNNKARLSGGGIYNNKGSSPLLTNSIISFNEATGAGGIYNRDNSNAIITNVIVKNNTVTGSGGGVRNWRSDPIIINTIISDNEANAGGGFDNYASNPTLINVNIYNNTGRVRGGGFQNTEEESTAKLINVTIADNTAPYGANILTTPNSTTYIKNSIITDAIRSISIEMDSTLHFTNSLIEGSGGSENWNDNFGTDNGNNLDVDPKFVGNTYQLADDSPAIDMGDSSFVPNDIVRDLAGNNRIVGAAVDMGAYENQSIRITDVTNPSAIEVDFGTGETDLNLPEKVTVTLSDNTSVNVDVDWDTSPYNGNEHGSYTLTGSLKNLPANVVNPSNLKAEISVKVNEQVIPDREISAPVYSSVPLKTGHYNEIDLPLPNKVEVSLNDGSKVELGVVWENESEPIYDKDTVGNYLFSGEFVLVDGITNPHHHLAQRMFVLTDAVVTVTHVDVDGNELASSQTLTGKVNDEYETKPVDISGYSLTEIPANATGKFTVRDIDVNYVYSKDDEVVADREIVGVISKATMKDVGTIELADVHSLLPDKVTVELDDGEEIELKVARWDADSTPAYDKDATGMYIFNGDIELIDGIANSNGIRAKFSLSLNEVNKPIESDKIIAEPYHAWTPLKTGIYEQTSLPLRDKVRVILNDGSTVVLEVVWRTNSEPAYDKDTAGTYRFSGDYILVDGIINPHGHLATYDFVLSDNDQANDSSVIVTYVDEDGKELAPTQTLTGIKGEAYQTEVEKIEGYTFEKVNGNVSGTFAETTIFVEYVYSKEKAPVDADQNKEIMNVPVIGTVVGVGEVDLDDILARFPSTVEVTLDDDTIVELGVRWDEMSEPTYDKNKVGAYIFSGELILTDGIVNTANYTILYQVNVSDYDKVIPIDPENPIDEGKGGSSKVTIVDDSADSDDEKDIMITTDEKSSKLPKTATHYYTILYAGLLLMIIGFVTYLIFRRKRVI